MPEEERYIDDPLIAPGTVARREYQVRIATKALQVPTLVVLPTGLGKTVVALLFIAERLKYDGRPVLVMAPTKPLVEQHFSFFQSTLRDVEVRMLTGEVPPERRGGIYLEAPLVIATPQVVKNDILSGDLDISTFGSMVVDEAHRATGDYSYTFIAERFYEADPGGLVLGLTASPGHDLERIYEVCANLGIEGIEVRVDSDPDVTPYIKEMEIDWVKVEVSKPMREIIGILERMFLERVGKLQRMGLLPKGRALSVRSIIGAGGRIQEAIRKAPDSAGPYYQAMSVQAQAMKISHALELAETQGADALYSYLDRMISETSGEKTSRATRSVISDPLFPMLLNKVEAQRGEAHPKVDAVERFIRQRLREDPGARIIVFTHFRDTASNVLSRLEPLKEQGINAVRFVGQASRGGDQGLTQKVQKGLLDGFRRGETNVLIATSVAEEGLDIPGADLVIFFEPIPSEIRTIQRRGRTGRHSAGRVVVLMSKETRDVAYSWSAKDKEKRMERQLLMLRKMLSKRPLEGKKKPAEGRPEGTLDSFVEPVKENSGPEISVDQREMVSGVVEELVRQGARIRTSSLQVGDYLISDRVAVERKTVEDLSDSLVDGRLFEQAGRLRDSFERPLIVIEGDNIFGHRKISREALLGALSALTVDLSIPLVFTQDAKGTADLIMITARREGEKRPGRVRRPPSQGKDLRSIQLDVLSGLPGVSSVLAGRILDRFSTLERVFSASEVELREVPGIGPGKAREIRSLASQEGVP